MTRRGKVTVYFLRFLLLIVKLFELIELVVLSVFSKFNTSLYLKNSVCTSILSKQFGCIIENSNLYMFVINKSLFFK